MVRRLVAVALLLGVLVPLGDVVMSATVRPPADAYARIDPAFAASGWVRYSVYYVPTEKPAGSRAWTNDPDYLG